jgi:hypothetical protein
VSGGDGGGSKCREAGREEVGEVVQAGGGPSEIPVGRLRVADHRVQSVDGLVGEGPGRPQQEAVEHRGYDTVARVLGYRLDGRPGDLARGEVLRVAPDELSDTGAGRRQIAVLQLAFDGEGGLREAAHREGGRKEPDLEGPPELRRR